MLKLICFTGFLLLLYLNGKQLKVTYRSLYQSTVYGSNVQRHVGQNTRLYKPMAGKSNWNRTHPILQRGRNNRF